MKSKLKTIPLYAIAALALAGCGDQPTEKHSQKKSYEEKEALKQDEPNHDEKGDVEIKKVSQALGNFIGRNLNSPGVHFDLESIIVGIRDGAAGKPSPMNDQEYEKAMSQLQQQAIAAVSSKNLDDANAFLKENAQEKGVVEIIPEKLQYTILQEGKDPAVEEHGSPQITYTGKYLDGSVFGSSDAAGGPITVPLDQTIPGFSKGIVGMKEGEKRRLFVHPEVGYGTSGQLLPNSLLIFDIEVIKAKSHDKDEAEAFHGKDLDSDEDKDSNEKETPEQQS